VVLNATRMRDGDVVLQLGGGVYGFFQAEAGIRVRNVTGVQTCALPIWNGPKRATGYSSPVDTSPHSVAREPGTASPSQSRMPDSDRKSVVEGKGVEVGGRAGATGDATRRLMRSLARNDSEEHDTLSQDG